MESSAPSPPIPRWVRENAREQALPLRQRAYLLIALLVSVAVFALTVVASITTWSRLSGLILVQAVMGISVVASGVFAMACAKNAVADVCLTPLARYLLEQRWMQITGLALYCANQEHLAHIRSWLDGECREVCGMPPGQERSSKRATLLQAAEILTTLRRHVPDEIWRAGDDEDLGSDPGTPSDRTIQHKAAMVTRADAYLRFACPTCGMRGYKVATQVASSGTWTVRCRSKACWTRFRYSAPPPDPALSADDTLP